MHFARILHELWGRKLLLALGFILAGFGGISSVASVGPGGVEPKTIEFATARTQVLVDYPRSSVADTAKDFAPLIARAGVYARLMVSPSTLDMIGKAAGVPSNMIYAQGPFELNVPRIEQEPTAERRGAQLLGEKAPYKLRFESNPQYPVISIFSQAPTTKEAVGLAQGTAKALDAYVRKLQDEGSVADQDRVQIRQLGDAVGGMVNSGASKKLAVITFMFLFAVWCVVLLAVPRFLAAWRVTRPLPQNPDAPLADEQLDEFNQRLHRVS